ncbi:hypothetical protein [Noviherbaspirillum sedimenti]|uniref:hypothetical protein n=1 Tax=Noviherbaspirillum sedimenti TaxID=2320865 RepID=UPI001F2992BF|nr:hypothetical protein [Noviherbaspirillum sedimenti]
MEVVRIGATRTYFAFDHFFKARQIALILRWEAIFACRLIQRRFLGFHGQEYAGFVGIQRFQHNPAFASGAAGITPGNAVFRNLFSDFRIPLHFLAIFFCSPMQMRIIELVH